MFSKYLKQLCIEEDELHCSIILSDNLFALFSFRCLTFSISGSGGFFLLFLLSWLLRILLILCLRIHLFLAGALMIFFLYRLTGLSIVFSFDYFRGRSLLLLQAPIVDLGLYLFDIFIVLLGPLVDHEVVSPDLFFLIIIKFIVINEAHQISLEGMINPTLIVKLEQSNETVAVGTLEPSSPHRSSLSIIFNNYL